MQTRFSLNAVPLSTAPLNTIPLSATPLSTAPLNATPLNASFFTYECLNTFSINKTIILKYY